jgi:hypothetical protein
MARYHKMVVGGMAKACTTGMLLLLRSGPISMHVAMAVPAPNPHQAFGRWPSRLWLCPRVASGQDIAYLWGWLLACLWHCPSVARSVPISEVGCWPVCGTAQRWPGQCLSLRLAAGLFVALSTGSQVSAYLWGWLLACLRHCPRVARSVPISEVGCWPVWGTVQGWPGQCLSLRLAAGLFEALSKGGQVSAYL